MKNSFTVKVYYEEKFPTPDECLKEMETTLMVIGDANNWIELTIESPEPDNTDEPEYQKPTYLVQIIQKNVVVDQIVHPFDFENMDLKETIHTMVDFYMNTDIDKEY